MPDQQPHTPSLDQMRDLYVRHADQLGIASNHVLHAEFDRFLATAEQRGAARAEQAIYELTEAIRFTVEYVGNDTLPPIDGWSWFDALRKYRPELAEHFEQNPQLRPDNHVTREIIADQIQDRADQEGDDE